MWFFWTVIAYLLNALAVLIDKSLFHTKQVKQPASYVIVICSLGLLVFALAPWGLTSPTAYGWILSSLAGLSFTGALLLLFTAIQKAEVSRVTSFIGAWSPVFVLLISFLWFGEKLVWYEIMAFVLLVAGGFLMATGKRGLKLDTITLSLVAALGFAIFYTLSKATFTELGFISGLIWIRATSFIFCLFLFLIPSTWESLKNNRQVKARVKVAFFTGQVAAALSALLINYAISLGSVTLINAMQGLQYIFLLGLVAALSISRPELLQEELSGHVLYRKIVAIVLIGGGLVLIAGSSL